MNPNLDQPKPMSAHTRRNGIPAISARSEGHFEIEPYLKDRADVAPCFTTPYGALFAADCLAILPNIAHQVVDTVFADPPFNLGKEYGGSTDDLQSDGAYLDWCRRWLAECVRVLKPGGSLFVYNLPRWNILLGAHLTDLGMDFRHWIAVEMSAVPADRGAAASQPLQPALLLQGQAEHLPPDPDARTDLPALRR